MSTLLISYAKPVAIVLSVIILLLILKQFTSTNKSEISGGVQKEISGSPIVVFSSSTCPYCADAISTLRAQGISPKVIEASGTQRSELKALTGSSSVPSVWINGKFVGGCNDGPESWMGIKKIIKNNKLDELLASR